MITESARFKSYVNKNEEMLFSAVKPSETVKTLNLLAGDTHFLLRQFSSNEKVKSMSSFAATLIALGLNILRSTRYKNDQKVAFAV